MGIDIHIGDHYYAFRIPTPVLVVLGVAVFYGVVKAGRYLTTFL
jgi:hypothetical protein